MWKFEVEVQLPRFKMEEKYDLKKLLISMGMEDAFDSTKSDFSGETHHTNETESPAWLRCVQLSTQTVKHHLRKKQKNTITDFWALFLHLIGMSPANDLLMSKVVHKAFVDVNEEGTEAAAATGLVLEARMLTLSEEFIADHPFLFFIRHNTTKNILFVGRYCSPM